MNNKPLLAQIGKTIYVRTVDEETHKLKVQGIEGYWLIGSEQYVVLPEGKTIEKTIYLNLRNIVGFTIN